MSERCRAARSLIKRWRDMGPDPVMTQRINDLEAEMGCREGCKPGGMCRWVGCERDPLAALGNAAKPEVPQ